MTQCVVVNRVVQTWDKDLPYDPKKRYAWSIKFDEQVWRGGKKEKKSHNLYIIAKESSGELHSCMRREFPHCHYATNYYPGR